MLIFFDTEFTELGIDPKLISIGLVSEDGNREFYAELSDTYQPSDCSDFVREAVLPHLQGGEVLVTMHDLSICLVDWLTALNVPVQLVTDSISWDWPWMQEVFAEAGVWPGNVDGKPKQIRELAVFPAFNQAVEGAYANGLRRHHALDDAKANRQGCLPLATA